MSMYEICELNIAQLQLDKMNPRHENKESQPETIKAMIEDQKDRDKLFKLAGDIVKFGVNPSDLPIVIPIDSSKNEYVVLEGNRRIAALQLLNNPSLISINQLKSFRNKISALSGEFRVNPIKKINCVAFESRKRAIHWIALKHTGQNKGIGTVRWESSGVARFNQTWKKEKALSLQAKDFMREHGNLDESTKKKLNLIATSNLDRLLGDIDVRKFLGLDVIDGELVSYFEKNEVVKGLTRIIKDLAHQKINVNVIRHKKDRRDYLLSFRRSEVPDPDNTSDIKWSLDLPIGENEQSKKSGKKRKSVQSPSKRKKLIPTTCVLRIPDKKINTIYYELKKLDVNEYKCSVSILMRVFLELSVDSYLDRHKIVRHDEYLVKRFQKVIDFLKDNSILNKDELKPLNIMISNKHDLFSTNTLNAYVHNKYLIPEPINLKVSWDNIQLFMETIWD